MAKRTRRNHGAAFKAVAAEAVKGEIEKEGNETKR
jgi:hypothetical protein